MELFYKPGSCSLASHIVLRESKANFSLRRVDLKNKSFNEKGDYFLINPKGQVPSLVLDDGSVLTESIAILQYVADNSPNCQFLAPIGDIARYKTLEWLSYIGTELHKNFTPLYCPDIPEEYKQIMRLSLEKKLIYVNDALKNKYWIYGTYFTIADAYLFTILRWADSMLNTSKLKHIKDYMCRLTNRPSVSASLMAEGLNVN